MPAQSGPSGPQDGSTGASPDVPSTRPTSTSVPEPTASAAELKTAAQDVGDAVKSAGVALKHRIAEKSADKVNSATDTAGASLHQIAEQLKQAADGLGDDNAAWVGQAFRRGADGIEKVSGYLANGRFEDFTRDLKSFARSDPALFLAGSVALGFAAARVARVAASRASDTADETTGQVRLDGGSMSEPRSFSPSTGMDDTRPTGSAKPGETL